MKAAEQLIVTFTCNNHVHVYYEKKRSITNASF
jgi:hypothetical protein